MIISESEKNRIRKLHREYSIIKEQTRTGEFTTHPSATWPDFWKYWGFRPGDEDHQDLSRRRDEFWAKEGAYATLLDPRIIACSPTLKVWSEKVDEGWMRNKLTIESAILSPEEKTDFENTVNLQEVIDCYNKFNKGEASFYVDTEDDAVPSITHDYRTSK